MSEHFYTNTIHRSTIHFSLLSSFFCSHLSSFFCSYLSSFFCSHLSSFFCSYLSSFFCSHLSSGCSLLFPLLLLVWLLFHYCALSIKLVHLVISSHVLLCRTQANSSHDYSSATSGTAAALARDGRLYDASQSVLAIDAPFIDRVRLPFNHLTFLPLCTLSNLRVFERKSVL